MIDIEDFVYPPSGGWAKLVILGMVIPGFIAWSATQAWLSQTAYWPGRNGTSMIVHGETALALATVYWSIALFFHFRWCWGLLQFNRTFTGGTVFSLLLFLFALLTACAFL